MRRRNKMMNIRRFLGLGVVALAYAGIASAATVTYTATFGPAVTDITNGLMSLPLFNNLTGAFAGDTLTGVSLTLGTTVDISSLELKNTSGSAQTFKISSIVDSGTGGTSVNAADTITVPTFTTFTTGLSQVTLGSSGGLCAPSTPTVSCNDVFYTPPDIASNNSGSKVSSCISCYLWLGGVNPTNFTETGVTSTSTTFTGGGGNITLTQATNATFVATVTYTYTTPNNSTPEPATMALMGSALLGVGFLRKRFKTNKQ